MQSSEKFCFLKNWVVRGHNSPLHLKAGFAGAQHFPGRPGWAKAYIRSLSGDTQLVEIHRQGSRSEFSMGTKSGEL